MEEDNDGDNYDNDSGNDCLACNGRNNEGCCVLMPYEAKLPLPLPPLPGFNAAVSANLPFNALAGRFIRVGRQ